MCIMYACVYQSLRDVLGFPGITQGRAQSRLIKCIFGGLHNQTQRIRCIVPIRHGVQRMIRSHLRSFDITSLYSFVRRTCHAEFIY